MKAFRGLLTALAIIMLFVSCLVAWRFWEYNKQEKFRLGISAVKSEDYNLAYEYLLPYAESGNASAQRILGQIYAFGLGRQSNVLRARIWFRRADCNNSNNGDSEYFVALDFLDEGHLAAVDMTKALEWLEIAAEAGNQKAQVLLADRAKQSKMKLSVPQEMADQWQKFLEK